MVWRKALPEDAKQKIYYFFMQYGRFGDPEKVQRERKILAEMSDGWGPFLASSNAQLLDVRQIEAFKALVDAQTENEDRKNVVWGKRVSESVNIGGRRDVKKKKNKKNEQTKRN